MTTTEIATNNAVMLERVVLGGDLSKLTSPERMQYYTELCHSLRLNPLTQPFQYLNLSGRLVLYARKDATEQLRKQHGVSITKLEATTTEGVYVVTAYAKDATGREDVATGAVAIENLKGEAKANALLKAETKAKRRVTLSLCGLGMLDETEVETIPGAQPLTIEEVSGSVDVGATQIGPETIDQEGDRLFKTPEEMEREEKVGVLEAIAKGYQVLKMHEPMQRVLWKKHMASESFLDPFLDPDGVSLDALNALLGELRALHRAAESRKR